jgi:hypothetical protein
MEIIVIFALIAGLLIGWFLMMREEVVGLLLRAVQAIRTRRQERPAELPGVFASEPCPVASNTDPSSEPAIDASQIQRKTPDTEGGIPTWTIG